MQDNIFAPLGMTSTGYGVTPDMQARQATIHQRAPDGTIGLLDPQPAINSGREYGGGGLNGTAPDYQRFIRMILNGGSGNGNQLLRPETVGRDVEEPDGRGARPDAADDEPGALARRRVLPGRAGSRA